MKVLIVQSDLETAQTLTDIFIQRDDQVYTTIEIGDAIPILQQEKPNLLVLDLHLPEDALIELLRGSRERYPDVNIIISNRYPDLSREMSIKELGVNLFLRAPFSKIWVEQVIKSLEEGDIEDEQSSRSIQSALPKVRIPVRLKIILPYLLLALLLAMGSGYVVSRVALDTIEDRFVNSLIEIGQLTNAWLVEEESNLLETLRLLAFTDGLSTATTENDAETLRELVLGLAINNQEEAIEILNSQGVALISIRHIPGGDRESYEYSKGDDIFRDQLFVQRVLERRIDEQGDKYAGLIKAPWGDYFYIAGPILNETNQLVGVVLIGRSIPTIVEETREKLLGEQSTIAHVSLYDLEGQIMQSTLIGLAESNLSEQSVIEILTHQDQDSQLRPIEFSGIEYREILGPWEVRGGQDFGIVGVSLAETFLVRPSQQTQIQIYVLATLGLLLIRIVGMMLARRITQPLSRVVTAASEVSRGKWDVSVDPKGDDELAVLAHTFNYMVSHLKEGEIYRDLLGRTITPQVRDQLRKGLASGNLKLEGQNTVASVMITDIRGFTVISENEAPTTVLGWLNQYWGELVPIINANDGVTNEFVGDSVMAFFGVLPVTLDASESARQACKAAVDILQAVKSMNAHRVERGEPSMVTGIGINTGVVAAGGMGTADRLHYSIIGDTVNVTQRIEALTKELGETSAIISEDTYQALGDYRDEFMIIPMGSHMFKGKSEPVLVYRLLPIKIELQGPKLININSALEEELMILKGINAKIASRIVAYRNTEGYFSHIEDIMNVSGIGPIKFGSIKNHISTNDHKKT